MKVIIIETGQCIIDIALQEYGMLEAANTICIDNSLSLDDDLHAGQKLNIRETGVDSIPYSDATVLANYQKKTYANGKKYIINSKVPGADQPGVTPSGLPSFYGSGAADLDEAGILALNIIYRNGRVTPDLPFVADMQRLWYVYPANYGFLIHAYQVGNYDQVTAFDLLNITLTINGNQEDYFAYRLKYDTYLVTADKFTISFE